MQRQNFSLVDEQTSSIDTDCLPRNDIDHVFSQRTDYTESCDALTETDYLFDVHPVRWFCTQSFVNEAASQLQSGLPRIVRRWTIVRTRFATHRILDYLQT